MIPEISLYVIDCIGFEEKQKNASQTAPKGFNNVDYSFWYYCVLGPL